MVQRILALRVGAGMDGVDDFQVLVVDDLHGALRRGHLIFEHGREVERGALFRCRVDGLFERCEALHAVFRVVDRERAVEEVVQPRHFPAQRRLGVGPEVSAQRLEGHFERRVVLTAEVHRPAHAVGRRRRTILRPCGHGCFSPFRP